MGGGGIQWTGWGRSSESGIVVSSKTSIMISHRNMLLYKICTVVSFYYRWV